MGRPRKYSDELRERAVRLNFESDRPVTHVASGGWSVYGAERSQPAATGGKWKERGNGKEYAKALEYRAFSYVFSRQWGR